MLRLAPLLLVGCAFISKDAHEDRLAALQQPPSEPPTAPDGAPVVQESYFRFSTNSGAVYNGVQIVFRAMDPDGDLEGGSIEVTDGGVIPLGSADSLGGDLYAFTVDHPLTNPCDPPDLTVRFALRDAAGNLGSETTVPIVWETYLHDESSIQSADQCEPCAGPVYFEDLPAVVCGFKGEEFGYIDFSDETEFLPGPGEDIEIVANFGQNAEDLALYVFEGGEQTASISSDNPGNEAPEVVRFTSNDTPGTVYTVRVTGTDPAFEFRNGNWALFIHTQLPEGQ